MQIHAGVSWRTLTAEPLDRQRSRRKIKRQTILDIRRFQITSADREVNILQFTNSF